MGARFSHNLAHDSSSQLVLPGGPLVMVDHNEIFNTGYVEGAHTVPATKVGLENSKTRENP